MAHEHATEAEEEYLQSIFWLHEAGLPMTAANLARAMQLSAPTVHEMVKRLERDGYVGATPQEARVHARGPGARRGIVRRHRLIERFLTDVLGIPWDEVHEEAERLEHAMSPVLEQRMLAAIGNAKTCPHGHPIEAGKRIEGVPLADVASRCRGADPALRERGRGPSALPQGRRARARPRGHVAAADDEEVTVDVRRHGATVTRSVAETVSVVADPSPPPRTALPEQLVLAKDRYGR